MSQYYLEVLARDPEAAIGQDSCLTIKVNLYSPARVTWDLPFTIEFYCPFSEIELSEHRYALKYQAEPRSWTATIDLQSRHNGGPPIIELALYIELSAPPGPKCLMPIILQTVAVETGPDFKVRSP